MNKKGQLEIEHYVILILGVAVIGCLAYIFLYKGADKVTETTKEDCINFMKNLATKVQVPVLNCPQDMMFLNEQGQLVYLYFCEPAENSSMNYIIIPGADTKKSQSLLWYYKNKTTKVTSIPQ